MKNRIYLKLTMGFIMAVAGIFVVSLALKTYTNMYDEKQEEVGSAIAKQAAQLPEEQAEQFTNEFDRHAQELNAKQQFLMIIYVMIFLMMVVSFFVLMLKNTITE